MAANSPDLFTFTDVGKTYLLARYASTNKGQEFSPISTIGIDFKTKQVTIDDYQIKLQVELTTFVKAALAKV